MPLYQVKCPDCGQYEEIFRKIAEMDSLPHCPVCNVAFRRLISAPMVRGGFEPYRSPGTGRYIDTPAKRDDDLKRSGSFLYEKGVEKDIERNRIARQEKDFAPIAAGVDAAVSNLVAAGQIKS